MILKRPVVRPWLQVPMLAAATVLLSTGMAALPAPNGWLLATGPGGAAGNLVLANAASYTKGFGLHLAAPILAAVFTVIGTTAWAASLGLSWSELRGVGRNLVGAAKWCRRIFGHAVYFFTPVKGARDRADPRFDSTTAKGNRAAQDDDVRYVHNDVGYNFRLTNIQAAIGVAM